MNNINLEFMKYIPIKMSVGNKFFTPNGIGRNGLSELECIAELVANSFDWNITKKVDTETTNIHVLTDRDNFIQIIDNGVGMDSGELDLATNLADDTDARDRLNDEYRKGMYGMGLKVACLSLGWKFTIVTISIKDPSVEYVFEFDSRKLENPDSSYMEQLKIVPRRKNTDSPLKDFKSGTSILIEDIVDSKNIPNPSTIADDMRSRFAPDMEI